MDEYIHAKKSICTISKSNEFTIANGILWAQNLRAVPKSRALPKYVYHPKLLQGWWCYMDPGYALDTNIPP
jgi:hypothetical protein